MRDESKDINWYLNNPRTRKWVVQCSVCNTSGYKHNAPEIFFGKVYLEKHFRPMQLNELGACEDCDCLANPDNESNDRPNRNVAIIVGAAPSFD